ncbi:hypothetical protein EVAR_20115_1 [Eumeta japonica]|uniref:Uncharacterized protein n=1 Tax=Eumeta variegata TaxID=151549 RepID=A0A4C1V3S3_EUMVA|nr:hypothetical protein EVAR_20115_1 [Eumeta japonica]
MPGASLYVFAEQTRPCTRYEVPCRASKPVGFSILLSVAAVIFRKEHEDQSPCSILIPLSLPLPIRKKPEKMRRRYVLYRSDTSAPPLVLSDPRGARIVAVPRGISCQEQCEKEKRACEPPEYSGPPPLMGTRDSGGITDTLPASWIGIGYMTKE